MLEKSLVVKLAPAVWKIVGTSNIYLIQSQDSFTLIDAGLRSERKQLQLFLGGLVELDLIERVIFTHLHYDHCGNFDLFPKALLLASKQEIEDFNKVPSQAVLDANMAAKLKNAHLKPVDDVKLPGLEIIPTPGHTRGSICIWMPKEKILFSGDTLFKNSLGRTDLPTSSPSKMQESINRLVDYSYKILCPGHDSNSI
ncbi:MAG: MBL fold metallo-hydrolase [Candidatus Woesearchaeota archaeon]